MRNFSAALVAVFLAGPASAQMVVNATQTLLQPQIARDEKGFKSCGVRALVLVNDGKRGLVYDFSVHAYPDNVYGLIKAGSYAAEEKSKPIQPLPVNFWIAAATDAVPVRPSKLIPAETAGYILGGIELPDGIRIMQQLASGKRMQFALRYKAEPLDRAVSFQKKFDDTDMETFNACMDGLLVRLEALGGEAETPPAKK